MPCQHVLQREAPSASMHAYMTRSLPHRSGLFSSMVPKSFRTRKAVAKSQTFRLQNCFRYIFLTWIEVPFIREVLGAYNSLSSNTDELKIALRARKVSEAFEKRAWGPFLERPGNLTGPKSYFEIKVSRKVGCVLTYNEVHLVALADNFTVQCLNHLKFPSGMENKTA